MYNAPPPHLMQGIHLLESGRRIEALPYLRHAARTEPIPADGWLWLAAATDDREEYRYCVTQALHLDPYHPVAARMRAELERQDAWPVATGAGYAPVNASMGAPTGSFPEIYPTMRQELPRRPSRLRRVLRGLVLGILLGGCLGVLASLAVSGVVQDAARDWLQGGDEHTLQFTVGDSPGFRFRVAVPDSWMPANTDSQSWRDTRDALMKQFPVPEDQPSPWEEVEKSFSSAVRDPVYGTMLPPVSLVETDADRLAGQGMIAALTLREIMPLPKEPAGSVCERLDRVRSQFESEASGRGEVIESRVVERRAPDDCIVILDRRFLDLSPQEIPYPVPGSAAPDAIREIKLAVPVGAELYAVWTLIVADAAAGEYADAITQIRESLASP